MGKINDNKGYLISNLHNFTPKKIINSNHITTQGLAFPIKANNIILYPNTGDYIFNTKKVTEKMIKFNQGGIQINPQNKGKFTQYAKNKGMSVQEAANWVMNNSKNPMLRKRANFAINATKFKRQEGGMQESPEMQIMQMVAQALQQGASPEEIMQILVEQGIPQEQAMQIIQQVMSEMQGQMSQEQPTNDMSEEMSEEGQPMMGNGGKFRSMPTMTRSIDATYVKPPAGFEMDYSDKTNEYYKPIEPNLNIRENKRMYEDFKENRSKVPPFYYGKPLQYRGPYVKTAPMMKSYGPNDPSRYEGEAIYDNPAMYGYKLGGYMNKYQKGGPKYNPNGYDVISEQMFNDIQKMNGNAPMNYNDYQEQMSRKLAMEDSNEMARRAQQNQNMGEQMLPKPVYDYLMKNKRNTPQVRQYIDPNYMMKNQMYLEGGSKYGMIGPTEYQEALSYARPQEQQSLYGQLAMPQFEMEEVMYVPKFQMEEEVKPLKSIQRTKVPTFTQSTKFGDAFKKARTQGAESFLHNGKLYTTQLANEVTQNSNAQRNVPTNTARMVNQPQTSNQTMATVNPSSKIYRGKELDNVVIRATRPSSAKNTTLPVMPSVYSGPIPEQGTISASKSQGMLSKGWDIINNPVKAFGYAANNQRIPDNFTYDGGRDAYDVALEIPKLAIPGFGALKGAKYAKTLVNKNTAKLAGDLTQKMATQLPKLVKNPGAMQSQITGYLNMLKKINTIESNQIYNSIQNAAKNPTQLKKLMKMLEQTKLMDFQ